MSRCFPYPPPGYSGNRATNDALIESIKLQREREKAKAESKREKKREKKEKRNEKKEKKKATSVATPLDESAQKGEHRIKIMEDSHEQLTRSGLTEEHGQPISLHKPSYSSDSTQNSNKRKRPSSPVNTTSNGFQRNTFRIRLPMQKHKEPFASAGKAPTCSTSGRTDSYAQQKHEVVKEATRYRDICSPPLVKDSVQKKLMARPELKNRIGKTEIFLQDTRPALARTDNPVNRTIAKAEIFVEDKTQDKRLTAFRADNSVNAAIRKAEISAASTTIGKAEIYAQDKRLTAARSEDASITTLEKAKLVQEDKRPTTSVPTYSHSKLKRVGKRYMELFKNWVPPPLEITLPDSDDQEWLFGGKRKKREEGEKRIKESDAVSCCASYALQPVARYFPEADIYALPYTVPF